MKKMIISYSIPILVGIMATIFGAQTYALADDPLVEFLFEANLINSGTLGGTGSFITNTVAPVYTSAGSGVDSVGYAMDNRSVPSMGGSGGYVKLADDNGLDDLKSFTIQFWYRTQTPLVNTTRLICKRDGTKGFEFIANLANRLEIFIGDDSAYEREWNTGYVSEYGSLHRWVFAAITCTTTTGVNNVHLYAGERSGSVRLVYTGSIDTNNVQATAANNTKDLFIGCSSMSPGTLAFKGLMDNVRIWGSQTDGSGELSLNDLQTVFEQDRGIWPPVGKPLVELLFETNLYNTGYMEGIASFVQNNSVIPSFSTGGEGVNGIGYSMDNRSVPTMNGTGGYASFPSISALNGLKSFTIQTWWRHETSGINARLIAKRGGTSQIRGYEIYTGNNNGKINLFLGDDSGVYRYPASAVSSDYQASNQWVFAAVTYDGTTNVNNTAFYSGVKGGSLSLVSQSNIDNNTVDGAAATNPQQLVIGANSMIIDGANAFKGYIDNVRIWGSQTNDAGALTQSELEYWFALDTWRTPQGMIITIQ